MTSIYELIGEKSIFIDIPIRNSFPVIIDLRGKTKKEVKEFYNDTLVIDSSHIEKTKEIIKNNLIGAMLIYITYVQGGEHPTKDEISLIIKEISSDLKNNL